MGIAEKQSTEEREPLVHNHEPVRPGWLSRLVRYQSCSSQCHGVRYSTTLFRLCFFFFFIIIILMAMNSFSYPPLFILRRISSSTSIPPLRASSRSSSSSSDMDATAGLSLYPSHHTKTIHLVRHAQGFHNEAGDKDSREYLSYDYFDAQLTSLGWKQVDNLRKHVQSCGLSKRIELVITSPLFRTMQTAVGAFGGDGYSDGVTVPPLMVANAGGSNRPAISSLNCPPFLAVELCREHMGIHPCDKRGSISEYRSLFPAIDFSMIEHDDDMLWKPDIRETNEEVAVRGLKFLKWLWTRKEKEIAVVSHCGFIFHAMSAFGNDCHPPSIKAEICNSFANCELRSIVLIDRSVVESKSSMTNFPGGLLRELDFAAEKHLEKGVTNEDVA